MSFISLALTKKTEISVKNCQKMKTKRKNKIIVKIEVYRITKIKKKKRGIHERNFIQMAFHCVCKINQNL